MDDVLMRLYENDIISEEAFRMWKDDPFDHSVFAAKEKRVALAEHVKKVRDLLTDGSKQSDSAK
jgi:hypothetical protein